MSIRIAVVSDLHTTASRQGEQPEYRARLARAIAAINAERPALVLIPGDMTDNGRPHEFAAFRARIRAFRAPARYVPGNHDVGDKARPGSGPIDAELSIAYERALGRSYYAETIAGVRLIALNASLLGSGASVDTPQQAMIRSEAARPAEEPVVVMLHYPPFLETPDEIGGDYWTLEPGPRAQVMDLVHATRARAVVSGHLHRPNDVTREGTRFVTAPSVAFGLPVATQAEGWALLDIRTDGSVAAENRYVAEPGPVEPYFLGRKPRLTELMQ